MKFNPVGRNVLILLDPVEAVTPGGVVIPDTVQEPVLIGKVVAAGGDVRTVCFEDRVMVTPRCGHNISIGGKDHLLVDEKAIEAVIGEQ